MYLYVFVVLCPGIVLKCVHLYVFAVLCPDMVLKRVKVYGY